MNDNLSSAFFTQILSQSEMRDPRVCLHELLGACELTSELFDAKKLYDPDTPLHDLLR